MNFRLLAESLPCLVWTADVGGSFGYLGPQWQAFTGVEPHAMLGEGWLTRLHPDDLEATTRLWAEATEGGVATETVFETRFRLCRHDGVYRWFSCRAVFQCDVGGGPSKWLGSCTDVGDHPDGSDGKGLSAQVKDAAFRTEKLDEANHRLEALRAQLETAQELNQVGSWEYDLIADKVHWSDVLFRIFELKPPNAPNYLEQTKLFSPTSWATLSAAVERAATLGEGYKLKLEVITTTGNRRLALARCKALKDEEGRVIRLVGSFQDVTETEINSQRLRLATDAAQMGVWDWDVSSDVLVWDEAMLRLYNVEPDAFGSTYEAWRARLHPEDREMVASLMAQALEGTADFNPTFRIVRSDGSVAHLRAAASVYRDEAGRPVRVVGVNWDVTQQRVAELGLQHTEALQRAILAGAGSAIIATDTEGTITLFNEAAEEFTGYSAEELVGKHNPGLFHDPAEVTAKIADLSAEGFDIGAPFDAFIVRTKAGRSEVGEWTYVRKDGREVPVLLTTTALREAGQVVGYLGIAVDLTRQKQQENELVALNGRLKEQTKQAESANQAKSQFLANMSHEIRTPLGAITGVSYLLGKAGLTPEQAEYLQMIESATHSLMRMINDVLDISKIEARQLSLECVPFALDDLVADVRSMMSALGQGGGLRLSVELDESLPRCLVGDQVRLNQILTNLVGNAIKHTDAGFVRVSLFASASRDELRIEVSDSGTGIAPDDCKTLFAPFQQAECSPNRGGTGLGLAIVRELASLMGGRVGVDSELGKGSQFWCQVPLIEAPHASEPAPSAAAVVAATDSWQLKGSRFLVVDDNAVNRAIAKRMLELEGASVTLAEDGYQAVASAFAQTPPFDVVLMDVQMPGIDGIEATRQIRQKLSSEALPIIALTAGVLATERERALAGGVDDFIAKPFDPQKLIRALQQCVRRGPRAEAAGASSTEAVAAAPEEAVVAAPEEAFVEEVAGPELWPVVDGIDRGKVRERFAGDVSLFKEVARIFVEDLLGLETLLGDASRQDPMRWARIFHGARGAASNLAAGQLCSELQCAEATLAKRAMTEEEVAALRSTVATLRFGLARGCRFEQVPASDAASSMGAGPLPCPSGQPQKGRVRGLE